MISWYPSPKTRKSLHKACTTAACVQKSCIGNSRLDASDVDATVRCLALLQRFPMENRDRDDALSQLFTFTGQSATKKLKRSIDSQAIDVGSMWRSVTSRMHAAVFVAVCHVWMSRGVHATRTGVTARACGVPACVYKDIVDPDSDVNTEPPRVLLALAERLERYHTAIRPTCKWFLYLEAVFDSIFQAILYPSASEQCVAGQTGARIDRHGQTAIMKSEDVENVAHLFAGIVVRLSAWEYISLGVLGPADLGEREQWVRVCASCKPLSDSPREWSDVRKRVIDDVTQAAAQTTAQRTIINLRQRAFGLWCFPISWDQGVTRGINWVEKNIGVTEANELHALTYRSVSKMWEDESPVVQAVVYAVCRSALQHQHGKEVGDWMDEHAPYYSFAANKGSVGGLFGPPHRRRARCIDYLSDVFSRELYDPRDFAAPQSASSRPGEAQPNGRPRGAGLPSTLCAVLTGT